MTDYSARVFTGCPKHIRKRSGYVVGCALCTTAALTATLDILNEQSQRIDDLTKKSNPHFQDEFRPRNNVFPTVKTCPETTSCIPHGPHEWTLVGYRCWCPGYYISVSRVGNGG